MNTKKPNHIEEIIIQLPIGKNQEAEITIKTKIMNVPENIEENLTIKRELVIVIIHQVKVLKEK